MMSAPGRSGGNGREGDSAKAADARRGGLMRAVSLALGGILFGAATVGGSAAPPPASPPRPGVHSAPRLAGPRRPLRRRRG